MEYSIEIEETKNFQWVKFITCKGKNKIKVTLALISEYGVLDHKDTFQFPVFEFCQGGDFDDEWYGAVIAFFHANKEEIHQKVDNIIVKHIL